MYMTRSILQFQAFRAYFHFANLEQPKTKQL